MKFFHIRPKDDNGNFLRNGGTTIAYENRDVVRTKGVQPSKLLITFARCSERDVWNKDKAHLICRGRFNKGVKLREVTRPQGMDLYEFLTALSKEHDETVKNVRLQHQA